MTILNQESSYTDKDIAFLIETVAPSLIKKIDSVKNDLNFIEGMIEHESGKLLNRIISDSSNQFTTSVSPKFLFEVLLRQTRKELENHAYTIERTASQRVPVFDIKEVCEFLSDDKILKYLVDMLNSFTRIESYVIPVRIRKGIWRKYRFSDINLDSLLEMCQAVNEARRFGLYKRIADLCLFILGFFPEYVGVDYQTNIIENFRPILYRKARISAEACEEIGRRFYKLASEHRDAAEIGMEVILHKMYDKFDLAKKPLNYISDHYLKLRKKDIFPSFWPN